MKKTLALTKSKKEAKIMKKSLTILAITAMFVFASTAMAFAVTPYGPVLYNILTGDEFGSSTDNVAWPNTAGTGDDSPGVWPNNANPQGHSNQWEYFADGDARGYSFVGFTTSTHPQGTWNSPYTVGIDGYNYNDPQDYVDDDGGMIGPPMNQVSVVDGTITTLPTSVVGTVAYGFIWNTAMNPPMWFPVYPQSMLGGPAGLMAASTTGAKGPHGDYLTSTHKCRECHAVHRASGKFKLTRADDRSEACDWCHGKGAGSGFNIQMDNNDAQTREYDVGHSLGFNLNSGKWKAPDDTYPAYDLHSSTGGFSCFDCHSPHANKSRILGYIYNMRAMGAGMDFSSYPPAVATAAAYAQIPGIIINSGATDYDIYGTVKDEGHVVPWELWDPSASPVTAPKYKTIFPAGKWLLLEDPDDDENGIDDNDTMTTAGDSNTPALPVNKLPINWNYPYGTADEFDLMGGNAYFNMATCFGNTVSEFCTDCHDGNAGLHTQKSSLFSEDRALRNQASSYDIGYSHDAQPRH